MKSSFDKDFFMKTLKENKYIQVEKKFENSIELPDFQKFERDFALINKKLLELFNEFLIKDCDPEGILANNHLVSQLIWTFKYLVEMAILENNKDWLSEKPSFYKHQFNEIKHNINLADLDSKLQLQTCIDNALITAELALKETSQEIAFCWLENIFSLGGSTVREVSKIRRVGDAKLVLMEKSLNISLENRAAIINAENYEQWLREKTFYRDGSSFIANESRLQRLEIIQKRLKRDPKNSSLLELQGQLLDEQIQYEAKEQKIRSRLGEEKYQARLKEKQNMITKIEAKSELDNLIIEYTEAGKQLNIEGSNLNNDLLLQLDSLQKNFSKTLVTNSIGIDLKNYKELMQPILEAIQNLKVLSETPPEESTLELKREEEKEIKFFIPIRDLSSPDEWLLSEKLSHVDYTNLKTIKTTRKEYSLLSLAIAQSNHPSKSAFLEKNKISYETYIAKSAEFFLKQTMEQQIRFLYEIDETKEFTVPEIKKKNKELSLIYHPDKFSYIHINPDLFVKITAIQEYLLTRLKWKKIGDQVNTNMEAISDGIKVLKTWFSQLIPTGSGMDSVLQALRELNLFKTSQPPSITYQPSSTLSNH